MKRLGTYILLAGLIASVGCVSDSGSKRPSRATNPAGKSEPAPDQTPPPPPVTKLLPVEELNQQNGHQQADAMYKGLMKDRDQLGRTQTVSAGSSEDSFK